MGSKKITGYIPKDYGLDDILYIDEKSDNAIKTKYIYKNKGKKLDYHLGGWPPKKIIIEVIINE